MAGLIVTPLSSLDQWRKALDIRHEVFVLGQGVPEVLEVDKMDMEAAHLIATREGRAIGTGRLILEADGPLAAAAHATPAAHIPREKAKGRLPKLTTPSARPLRGRIGRMAVIDGERKQGVGRLILGTLEGMAWRAGADRVILTSQESAEGFYKLLGYTSVGEGFMEAGIPHIWMTKSRVPAKPLFEEGAWMP